MSSKNYEGTPVAEALGDEASVLCDEFLSFARRMSIGHDLLLAAVRLEVPAETKRQLTGYRGFLRRPVYETTVLTPGWHTYGYPLAYSKPKTAPFSRTHLGCPYTDFTPPQRDIMLCDDGCLRMGYGSLTDRRGHLETPLFGTWKTESISGYRTVGTIGNRAEDQHAEPDYTFSAIFEKTETLAGLRKVLAQHSSAILLSVERTH